MQSHCQKQLKITNKNQRTHSFMKRFKSSPMSLNTKQCVTRWLLQYSAVSPCKLPLTRNLITTLRSDQQLDRELKTPMPRTWRLTVWFQINWVRVRVLITDELINNRQLKLNIAQVWRCFKQNMLLVWRNLGLRLRVKIKVWRLGLREFRKTEQSLFWLLGLRAWLSKRKSQGLLEKLIKNYWLKKNKKQPKLNPWVEGPKRTPTVPKSTIWRASFTRKWKFSNNIKNSQPNSNSNNKTKKT